MNTYTDSAGGDWEFRYISRKLCDCSWTFLSYGIKPWTFIQCTLQGNRSHHWWHNLCKDLSTTTLSSASWSGMLQRQVYRSVKTLLNFAIVTYISFNTNQKSLLTTLRCVLRFITMEMTISLAGKTYKFSSTATSWPYPALPRPVIFALSSKASQVDLSFIRWTAAGSNLGTLLQPLNGSWSQQNCQTCMKEENYLHHGEASIVTQHAGSFGSVTLEMLLVGFLRGTRDEP